MKTHYLILMSLLITTSLGCKKRALNEGGIIPVPNSNFEYWNGALYLSDWQTNSCPPCVPSYQTYIVQQTTDAYNGRYAALFVYNNVFKSWAYNKFYINGQPVSLIGYVKSNITVGDTISIQIGLYAGNNLIDSANWHDISSIANYKEIIIPVSNLSTVADSASIKITGGGKLNTTLFVDDLQFVKF